MDTATGELAPDPVAVGPRFAIAPDGETGNPAGLVLQPDGSLIAARIGAEGAIFMRRFSVSGTPLGEDLEIIGAEVDNFHLSSGPNGDLVATWDLRNTGNKAWARRFDSMGQAIGDAFEVDESSPLDDHHVSPAAVAADGSFTVSWNRPQSADDHELLGRHFDSTGIAVGSPFVISSGTRSHRGSQIRWLPSSEQVVVWHGSEGMRGRNLNSAGLPIGADFEITSRSIYTGVHDEYMDTRVQSNGDFVVAWSILDSSYYGSYTSGAAFTSVGSPLPALNGLDRTGIDYDTAGSAKAISTPDDGFLIVWAAFNWMTTSRDRLEVRRYDQSRSLAQSFQIPTSGRSYRVEATARDQDFVISWGPWSEVNGFEKSTQRYTFNYLFADGFESEDLSRWSSDTP